MVLSLFLKRVLVLDAASCLAMSAVLWSAAQALSAPLGLTPALIAGAGLALIPIGLFILWLGTRTEAPAGFVYLVIIGNLAWAAESFILAFGDAAITGLGTLFVAGQGAAVLALALLEALGVRRSRVAAGA